MPVSARGAAPRTRGRDPPPPAPSRRTLTDRQRALARESWALVAPVAPRAAAPFAVRLFELDPAMRPIFAHMTDAEGETKRLYILAIAVSNRDARAA